MLGFVEDDVGRVGKSEFGIERSSPAQNHFAQDWKHIRNHTDRKLSHKLHFQGEERLAKGEHLA